MGCCPSAILSVFQTVRYWEKDGSEPLYRRGGRLARFELIMARVKSPVPSPDVLRLHIFDTEPPSVAGRATNNMLQHPVRLNIKISLHICNVYPTLALNYKHGENYKREKHYNKRQEGYN